MAEACNNNTTVLHSSGNNLNVKQSQRIVLQQNRAALMWNIAMHFMALESNINATP